MDIIALAAALSIMGAIIVGLLTLYQASVKPRVATDRRLGQLMGAAPGLEVTVDQFSGLRPKRAGKFPILSGLLEGKTWTEETAKRLERADMRLTVSEYVSLRIFLALGLGFIGFLILGSTPVGIIAMVVGGLIGSALPSLAVSRTASKRASKLNQQLPDALTLISNSIKAGFGLMQSLELASKELPHPFSTEIRRTLYDINVGSATNDALQAMAERCGSEDLDIVVTAMLIQQSSGGNLSEILDNVAHTMRERTPIRGEIKTLTSQQMLTGIVIGGLPIVMVGLFSLVNPEYMKPLFTETAGHIMLAGAGILEFFGILLIRRILAIEV